jgi:phage tail-like protein
MPLKLPRIPAWVPRLPGNAPPTGFHFAVEFSGGVSFPLIEGGFQDVSGLSMRTTMESIKEAGRYTALELPSGLTYDPLVLKRGLFTSSKLGLWVRSCIEDMDYDPVQVTIKLQSHRMYPLAVWQVFEAIPVSWSVSPFDANSSAIVVETLELKYSSFKFLPGLPDAR